MARRLLSALTMKTATVGCFIGAAAALVARTGHAQNPCPADLNADGVVDVDDFLIFASQFGTSCVPSQPCPTDFNGDGVTDDNDDAIFNSEFGKVCQPIDVSMTADNAYRLGWGPATGIDSAISFFPTVENPLNVDITSCGAAGVEKYRINPRPTDFIYVAAYSDKHVSQGLLGQFRSAAGVRVNTGDPAWSVCATSVNFDLGSNGPPVGPPVTPASSSSINEQIANCNRGGVPGNSGWVGASGGTSGNLAIGQHNADGAPDFGAIACVDGSARWMWFDESPATGLDPFKPGANHDEYLIFRLPAFTLLSPIRINEIDYDQPGTDSHEFIELINEGSQTVDLGEYTLRFERVGGGGAATMAGMLGPGARFVVCTIGSTVPNCDQHSLPPEFIDNGSPAAVYLTHGSDVIDTVSYAGDFPGFTEGHGAPADDGGANGFGLSRCPDGADTDDNSADFRVRPITPGTANDCGNGVPALNGALGPTLLAFLLLAIGSLLAAPRGELRSA